MVDTLLTVCTRYAVGDCCVFCWIYWGIAWIARLVAVVGYEVSRFGVEEGFGGDSGVGEVSCLKS